MKTYFIEVILPLALPNTFTYRVPRELSSSILVGTRVTVQFGKAKLYSAIVSSIHETPPEHYEAKYIHDVLDDEPIVTPEQFKLWNWMADYYMCTLGEVMSAALR